MIANNNDLPESKYTKFEWWAYQRGHNIAWHPDCSGVYQDPETEELWQAYQAGKKDNEKER